MNAGLFILGQPSQPGAARVGNMGMGSVECRPGQGGTLGPWHGAPDPNCPAGLQIPQAQLPKFSNVFQSRLTLQSSHPGCGAGPGTGVIPLGTKTFFSSHERLALPPPLPTVGRRRQRSPWGEKPYHLKWVCRFILAKPGGQARMGVNTDPDKWLIGLQPSHPNPGSGPVSAHSWWAQAAPPHKCLICLITSLLSFNHTFSLLP